MPVCTQVYTDPVKPKYYFDDKMPNPLLVLTLYN